MRHEIAPGGSSRASWLARSPGAAMLVLLCALAYLPGLWSIPPVDRDESRFAQASTQMLRSDSLEGWVVPRVGDRPRLNKPPLIYWLQASSAAILGAPDERSERGTAGVITGGVWRFRVPSFMAAIASVLLTWRLARSIGGMNGFTSWLAGAMLATSVIMLWDARQARADQLLLAVTTAAMWALWECWKRWNEGLATHGRGTVPWRLSVLFWVLVGVGVMTKGPITPLVALLTAVALAIMARDARWLRALRPFTGAGIVVGCALPWIFLVAREVGFSNYFSIVYEETIGRSASAAEGHWGPPGYHLFLLPVMFWPGSLFTALGLALLWRAPAAQSRESWWTRLRHADPSTLFLTAWIVPAWIVFELISTKLPHYTLPIYPALAIVSARAVGALSAQDDGESLGQSKAIARIGQALWVIIGIGITVAIPIVLWRFAGVTASAGTMLLLGAAIGAATGMMATAALMLRRNEFRRAQVVGLSAALAASVIIFGGMLPRLQAPWLSPALMEVLLRADPEQNRPIAAVGFHEDSLVFLTGARLARLGMPTIEPWLAEHPDGLLVLPKDKETDLAGTLASAAARIGSVRGFQYSKGRWVDLIVLDPAQGVAAPSESPSPVSSPVQAEE